jgi:purine-binding chemotaxis protein CheW
MSIFEATPAEDKALDELLRLRARRFAEPPAPETASTVSVLVCGRGPVRYGLELAELSELCAFRECTPIPDAPAGLVGVMNVRGEIRSVVDLRALSGLPADDGSAGYLVVLRRMQGAIGFRMDRIEDVRRIESRDLRPVSQGGDVSADRRFAKSITVDRILVIDVERVLSHLGVGLA